MGEMPANPIQLLGAGLVVTVWLAATSGAASAPATGSRLAGAQGREGSRLPDVGAQGAREDGRHRHSGTCGGVPEVSADRNGSLGLAEVPEGAVK